MFIQVPVVVAHKAHRTAADGVRLAVKHVDPRTVFNNHNFMEIMIMLRKCSLWEPWFNRDRRTSRRKKSTLCSTVIAAPTDEKCSQNSN